MHTPEKLTEILLALWNNVGGVKHEFIRHVVEIMRLRDAKIKELLEQVRALSAIEARRSWRPMDTAPKDGTYIMLAGPSGYNSVPLRVEVCCWDPEFRPLQPWVTHSGDSFMDGGEAPTGWLPLP